MSSGRWGARAEPASERGTMADEMTAFLVAVGRTSVVCYWLMIRVQKPQCAADERRQFR